MVRDAIPRALDGERLDRVVAFMSDVSRSEAATLVATGAVQIDGGVVLVGKQRVRAGQEVAVDLTDLPRDRPLTADPGVDFQVVHADEAVIVVDKPAGVVVHPGAGNLRGTLVQGLLARYAEIANVGDPQRPGIVHRLDVGSSGLLVVARTAGAHESLSQQFRTRRAGRAYRALVWGHPSARVGVIEAPIGRSPRDPLRRAVVADGKPARTHYRVRAELTGPADVAELECTLDTGRTHQIRVHLESVGHPLVGDTLYGRGRPVLGLTRPFLHAAELTIDHPTSGDRVTWSSDLPPDLQALLDDFEPSQRTG